MFTLLKQLQQTRRQAALPRGQVNRWMGIRHVDAGSCNGCEHELGLTGNPLHDIQRFGLDIVASPRHADILLVTGPITTAMVQPLQIAFAAMPTPRLVAALGDCPLGIGVLGAGERLAGPLDRILPVDIRIPGCPPSPELIAQTLLEALNVGPRTS